MLWFLISSSKYYIFCWSDRYWGIATAKESDWRFIKRNWASACWLFLWTDSTKNMIARTLMSGCFIWKESNTTHHSQTTIVCSPMYYALLPYESNLFADIHEMAHFESQIAKKILYQLRVGSRLERRMEWQREFLQKHCWKWTKNVVISHFFQEYIKWDGVQNCRAEQPFSSS